MAISSPSNSILGARRKSTAKEWQAVLKKAKPNAIRRKIYPDREEARRDVFNYIEMFYNPKCRHGYAGGALQT